MFQDYVVLVPQAYYEGAVLQDRLRNPCMLESNDQECLHYTYLDLSKYNQMDGGNATTPDGTEPLMETKRQYLIPLGNPDLAMVCRFHR